MFVFCLTWLTCLLNTNTNTFVVDRKHFFEITNICNHKFTNMFKLFNLPESHLYYGISSDYDNR